MSIAASDRKTRAIAKQTHQCDGVGRKGKRQTRPIEGMIPAATTMAPNTM